MLYCLPFYINRKIEKVKNISMFEVAEEKLLEKLIPEYASFTRDYSNIECEKQELLKVCREAKGTIKLVEEQKTILSRYKAWFEFRKNVESVQKKFDDSIRTIIIQKYNLSADEVEGKSSDEIMDMVSHSRSQSTFEEQPNLEEQSTTEEEPPKVKSIGTMPGSETL